jgi:hypothetical protein
VGTTHGNAKRIKRPTSAKSGGNPAVYYSHKSFYAINMQAGCDSAGRFLYLDPPPRLARRTTQPHGASRRVHARSVMASSTSASSLLETRRRRLTSRCRRRGTPSRTARVRAQQPACADMGHGQLNKASCIYKSSSK